MSVATSADDFVKNCLCSVAGVGIDGGVFYQSRVEGAGEDLSEIGDRLLVKLLGVADITEG